MRLPRRKKARLIDQQIDRVGILPYDRKTAHACVALCERGEAFEMVFFDGEMLFAKDVVRRLGLEPFVEGEVDWEARFPPSPLRQDFAGASMFEHLWELVLPRWQELYARENNPTIGNELEHVLHLMASRVAETHAEDTVMNNESYSKLWSMGSAGYTWRLAEEVHGGDGAGRRMREPVAEIVSRCVETERIQVLYWSAASCIGDQLPLHRASPGYMAYGLDFLDAGFRHCREGLDIPGAKVAESDQWYAFLFGVALREVKVVIDGREDDSTAADLPSSE
jgi:hypothetical protein